jgi:hypothetical protein
MGVLIRLLIRLTFIANSPTAPPSFPAIFLIESFYTAWAESSRWRSRIFGVASVRYTRN